MRRSAAVGGPVWLTSTIDQHADALQNVKRGKLPKGFVKLRGPDEPLNEPVPAPERAAGQLAGRPVAIGCARLPGWRGRR